ncbi:MIP/aquaporin family protein [Microbacterium sp. C7(2022)]|uniref:aquaporin n=1 Tax=Microbacterium sp. C7(2022) TaxID=2992759 RepID=UPI00237BE685|nr:MIP/aquaporin family protein [Microbacterium sp. C7(2022)]MDE0545213.1 aquaporin family protein [Microbacterium sp. C7(2022)]
MNTTAETTRPIDDVRLSRRLTAEFLGSAGLAAVVVGSGIAASELSPTDVGLQLLENAIATALGLAVLIVVFAPFGGAQFNPVVTLVDAVSRGRTWSDAAAYIPTQIAGCISGAVLANVMFAGPAVSISTTQRLTPATFLSEIVATTGLVLVIFLLARTERQSVIPWAVGAYIGAAYFFTSSTSFANPAITVGRMFSDTFAGIAPSSAPGFIGAQLLGATLAVLLLRWMGNPRSHP